jgi:hypothetical protein
MAEYYLISTRLSTDIQENLLEADLISAVCSAGFADVEIVKKHDIFDGVPNPSDALQFGTQGISLRAHKP